MVWVDQIMFSAIIILFALYIIVLQLSQLYTAQAYLLWPKIWPVKREYIQESYIRFSHKTMLVISLALAILFIVLHPTYFYVAVIFPLWGYFLNSYFSKSVYKKERQIYLCIFFHIISYYLLLRCYNFPIMELFYKQLFQ